MFLITSIYIVYYKNYENIDSTSWIKSAFFILLDPVTPCSFSQFLSTSTVSFFTVPSATMAAMSKFSLLAVLDAAEAAGLGLAVDGLDFFVGLNFSGS